MLAWAGFNLAYLVDTVFEAYFLDCLQRRSRFVAFYPRTRWRGLYERASPYMRWQLQTSYPCEIKLIEELPARATTART